MLKGPQQENDIARRSRQSSERRRAGTSALNEETGRLQAQDLIGGAEIGGLDTRRHGNRGIEIPSHDDRDRQWQQKRPRIWAFALRIAGHLLIARDRHMKVAAALVVGVKRGAVRSLVVARGANAAPRVSHALRVTMRAYFGSFRFVRSAVSDRNAQHPTRSRRDRPLHDEQEHGDEFDKGWGHLVGCIGWAEYTASVGLRFARFPGCAARNRPKCGHTSTPPRGNRFVGARIRRIKLTSHSGSANGTITQRLDAKCLVP
jgi:hypothetical protein